MTRRQGQTRSKNHRRGASFGQSKKSAEKKISFRPKPHTFKTQIHARPDISIHPDYALPISSASPLVSRALNQLKFAAKTFREWNRDKTLPADRWLARTFQENRKVIGSRDRKFISGSVHEALRNLTYYEYWIQKFSQSDLRDPVKQSKFLCLLGAIGDGSIDAKMFKILWNEVKDQAELENAEELFHAIRAHAISQSREEVSADGWRALRYSFPLWLVERWKKEFGEEECEALLAATHVRPPLVIRVNSLKISREELLSQFTPEEGAEAIPETKWGIRFKGYPQVKNLAAFNDGFFEIQSEASQRVMELVAPQPGEKAWDVCAGAGGKTLFLAALMQNQGQIFATDLRSLAIKELKLRAGRAGAENVKAADIQRFYKNEIQEQFDKIIVDAPCSGTGTLGRAPDLKWRLEEKSFDEYATKQLDILEMALPFLKPTGKIYYITCSIDPVENEGVMRTFLERHPDLCLCPMEGYADGWIRIWPHREPTDGFFMACFKYIGNIQ